MMTAQLCEPGTGSSSASAGLFAAAERELAAFLSAINQVYGPQCVAMATERWMQALNEVRFPHSASKKCFRKVTVSAVASLCHGRGRTVCEAQGPAQRRSANEIGESSRLDFYCC